MGSHFEFLTRTKKAAKNQKLSNLQTIAKDLNISHNAGTALKEMGLVRKRKKRSWLWKWVGGKVTTNKAIDLKDTTNYLTNKK